MFVVRALPEEVRASDVRRAVRQINLPVRGEDGIRQINGERAIVVFDSGTEQPGLLALQAKRPLRQIARPFVVDALDTLAKGLDIAPAVKNGKSLAVLEHAYAVIRQRRGREDVVAVLYSEDVIQKSFSSDLHDLSVLSPASWT